MIKPGDKLSNGAEVIMVLSAIGDIHLVMCRWEGAMPWVTWRVDKNGDTFWGRYFSYPEDAADNFNQRARQAVDVAGFYHTSLGV